MWHAARVGGYRKRAGIRYPKAYADSGDMAAAENPEKKHEMYLLNCAQRSHANYLENQPSVAIAMLITGIQYPRTTTMLGVGWVLSRIAYGVGYTRRDKTDGSGRAIGLGFFIFQLGLFGLSTWASIKMVL